MPNIPAVLSMLDKLNVIKKCWDWPAPAIHAAVANLIPDLVVPPAFMREFDGLINRVSDAKEYIDGVIELAKQYLTIEQLTAVVNRVASSIRCDEAVTTSAVATVGGVGTTALEATTAAGVGVAATSTLAPTAAGWGLWGWAIMGGSIGLGLIVGGVYWYCRNNSQKPVAIDVEARAARMVEARALLSNNSWVTFGGPSAAHHIMDQRRSAPALHLSSSV